ncbi:MAG: hypothetical protein M3174_04290 [Actinomycetota bacterium]|nr:hypothetical protein [Actinomycetota bacterium]
MRGRVAIALACAVLVLGACDDARERPPIGRAGPRADAGDREPRDERRMRERDRTRPQRTRGVPVRNLALNRADRRSVERAVADLKRLGFWKRLTREVETVIVSTRPGPGRVPPDGHLANAIRNVRLGRHAGYVCDVMIFSFALKRDVARQEIYYSEGRLPHPPPTLRQFWAVILAHELAHCTDRGARGEAYSTIWERRVLDAFGIARLGS